jgi:hypothetical protein
LPDLPSSPTTEVGSSETGADSRITVMPPSADFGDVDLLGTVEPGDPPGAVFDVAVAVASVVSPLCPAATTATLEPVPEAEDEAVLRFCRWTKKCFSAASFFASSSASANVGGGLLRGARLQHHVLVVWV